MVYSSISLWNVLGGLHSPNGIRFHLNKPNRVQNAVFILSLSATGTWWYPAAKSRVENQRTPDNASRDSSMRRKGNASLRILLFRSLKSTHRQRLPSFYFTSTMGEAKGLLLSLITHDSSSWQMCVLAISYSDVGMCLYF